MSNFNTFWINFLQNSTNNYTFWIKILHFLSNFNTFWINFVEFCRILFSDPLYYIIFLVILQLLLLILFIREGGLNISKKIGLKIDTIIYITKIISYLR
jgi:hypothetical protein